MSQPELAASVSLFAKHDPVGFQAHMAWVAAVIFCNIGRQWGNHETVECGACMNNVYRALCGEHGRLMPRADGQGA